jgi:hypothetical protein
MNLHYLIIIFKNACFKYKTLQMLAYVHTDNILYTKI